MKKYILKSLFVSMLCMLAASCQDTNEFEQTLDSSKAQVMFSVAMDSPMSRSRALTWGDDYTPDHIGDLYDNRIDANQLVVKIEAGGKTYKVNDIVKKQVGEVNEYTFVGVVEGIKQTTTLSNAKVSVFANMGRNAENLTFAQNAEYIPMWGMRTENLKLTPGERVQLSKISLLRAMAKIEVSLNADMAKQFALTGATLNRHNPTGNSLPTIKTGTNHTTDLELEGVFNPLSSTQQPLAFEKVENGNSYVVYLPEVARGKSDADHLNIEVQLNAKDEAGNLIKGAIEIGNFNVFDYSKNVDSPEVIDIVRNHWYKYNISGFAAGEIEVNYQAMDWNGVDINVGGEGFLFLNKDVIEIYNSNIDADQLRFYSSSPIKSVTLKDIYKHERNGSFTEGTTDGVYAYYMDKFGVLTQLSDEEGTDEATVLANISATVKEENKNVLNGGIVINSPFMADQDASETALQSESHYNTIRYLEFEVENEQRLKATFRVMQYPPVVITNEEGYFSYRSDQKLTDDQEEASHYHNYQGSTSFHCTGLYFYHEHEWSKEFEMTEEWWKSNRNERDYSWVVPQTCPANNKNSGVDIVNYGNIGNRVSWKNSSGVVQNKVYGGLYRPTAEPTDYFYRWRYNGIGASNNDSQGLSISALYDRDEIVDGQVVKRWYRKHYVWNVQIIFYNLFVNKVYQTAENNKQKGQADICSMTHSVTTYKDEQGTGWGIWGTQKFFNHRMYHIKTTATTDDYIVGKVDILDKDGKETNDAEFGVTANTQRNANIVSPSFMVASQLGESFYQSIVTAAAGYGYKVPVVGEFYKIAVEHCREYVETTYTDLNNNYQWDEGEPVTHYDDWRLPTKAEINKIIELQNSSRVMDRLLVGQYYFCAAGGGENADINKKENWVSNEVPGYTSGNTGYYIRCVRDVKPEGQNGFLEGQKNKN